MQDTGYYVDSNRQIIGPSSPTGLSFNEDEYVTRNGDEIGVYVEDGAFFRFGRKLFFIFNISSPTGHELTKDGKIFGPNKKLPWDGR